jgi:hypothetical protein
MFTGSKEPVPGVVSFVLSRLLLVTPFVVVVSPPVPKTSETSSTVPAVSGMTSGFPVGWKMLELPGSPPLSLMVSVVSTLVDVAPLEVGGLL